MKNLFSDFRFLPPPREERPLDQITRGKDEVARTLLAGCMEVAEESAQDVVWLVEHSRVVRVYEAAGRVVSRLRFDAVDIDELCEELDAFEKIPLTLSGPLGIYVSALVNHSREDRVVLHLEEHRRILHFLGYRLPEPKTLVVHGDVGDFAGAGLRGGCLIVEGSAGDWCGAGMMGGEIVVKSHTGENTGQWMRGGEIRVHESVQSAGDTLYGGQIYQNGQPLRAKAPPR